MTEEELKEMMALLEAEGWQPQLCDTQVPRFVGKASCGIPLEAGGDVEEMIPVPKALLSWGMQYFINARGDSMKGLGIEEGDMLRVDATRPACDGDVVVAYLDREITVKTLMSDEDGQQWLVPANDAYKAICLTDKPNVRMLGVVVANEKLAPRMGVPSALKAIRQAKASLVTPLSDDQVELAVKEVAVYVMLKRHWISVYRPLKERNAKIAESYETFCEGIAKIVPNHMNLPTVRELQRMDVQSFSKPVRLWDRDDAPVEGRRFDEYLTIANRFKASLQKYA